MSRRLRENLRKTFSVFFTFLLLFQYLSPVLIAFPQLRAQETEQATAAVEQPVEEETEAETTPTEQSSEEPETEEILDAAETPTASAEPTIVEVETQEESTDVEEEFEQSADFFVESVEPNHTYAFVDSAGRVVEIIFTQISETGSLTINEVTLSEEQQAKLGVTVGYDITSTMANGSFTYDLKLPVEESIADEEVVVKYAETEEEVAEGEALSVSEKQANAVWLRGMDHFTVFVVTNLEAAYDGTVTNRTEGYCPAGSDWIQVDPGYFGQATSMHYACPNEVGDDQATWRIGTDTDFESGDYYVFVSWTTAPNRDDAAEYTLNHTGGVYDFTVNQQLAADGSSIADNQWSGWKLVGADSFNLDTASNLVLTDSNTPGVHVIASDILLVGTDEVWVDDDWDGSAVGDEVVADKYYGYNAFSTIQEAIDGASVGGRINILSGSYVTAGQVVISKDLTVVGEDKSTTILKPGQDTSVSSDDSSAWFLVNKSIEFNLTGVTLDGNAPVRKVDKLIITYGTGTIEDNIFKNVKYSQYHGRALVIFGDVTVRENHFEGFQRIGVHIRKSYKDDSIGTGQVIDNTFQCKGDGDWLDYGIEVGASSYALLEANVISDCRGVASSDGSTSAAILVTDYYGVGTEANIKENILKDNSTGVYIGYDDPDATKANIHFNSFINNTEFGVFATPNTAVDASKNWWNHESGPSGFGPGTGDAVSDNVVFCPWLSSSDIDNLSLAGDCLGEIQGRKYIDHNQNGYQNNEEKPGISDWEIRLYVVNEGVYTLINSMLTGDDSAVVGSVDNDQFLFQNLVAGTYHVCEVTQPGYVQIAPAVGVNPQTTTGAVAPSPHHTSISVENNSPNKAEEGTTCWEVSIDESGDMMGYIKFGNIEIPDINAPEQTGYNENNGDSFAEPRPENELACTGASTNINGISVHWSEVTTGIDSLDALIRYQRQYNVNGGGWSENEIYTNPYTNYLSFGGGGGNEGTYGSRVRAFVDLNENGAFDAGEPVSSWSNDCSVTFDKTAPQIPTWKGVYLGHSSEGDLLTCGTQENPTYVNTPEVRFEWIPNSDDTVLYWFGTKSKQEHQPFNHPTTVKDGKMTPGNNPYWYTIKAVDGAGNNSLSEKCWVILDTEAPVSTISSPANGNVFSDTFTIEGNTQDVRGVSTVDLSYADYDENIGCSTYSSIGTIVADESIDFDWDYDWTPPVEGRYCIKAAGTDVAGNQEHSAVVENVIFDKTIPEISLSISPADPDGDRGWYITEPTVTLTANDSFGVKAIEYQWNSDADGGWTTVSATQVTVTPPSEAAHTLYYRAVDQADQRSEQGQKAVNFDQTVPEPVEDFSLDRDGNQIEVTWDAASDNTGIYRYQISWSNEDLGISNAETVSRDERSFTITNLEDGRWRVRIRAIDNPGLTADLVQFASIGEGVVAGVTTELINELVGLGFGGAFGVEEVAAQDTNETDSSAESAQTSDTESAGQVAGVTDETCVDWQFYWPVVLLLGFAAVAIIIEMMALRMGMSRHLITLALAIGVIILFYMTRNSNCYQGHALAQLDQWFWLAGSATAGAIILSSRFLISDEF